MILKQKYVSLYLSFTALLLLSGCTTSLVESPSWVNADRVEIHTDDFTDTFETDALDDGTIHAIADTYHRYGNGAMMLLVSYDPSSSTNTIRRAEGNLSNIVTRLKKAGVKSINASISPVRGGGDVSTTLIRFPALTAAPPEECGMMPGYHRASDEVQSNSGASPRYRLGCSIETLMARQVSRPSDLMGRRGFETPADGRRAERVISTRGYYGAAANTPLDGEAASGE